MVELAACCVVCEVLLYAQVRTEEEAIEIELNKIENQFRDYNRERDKKAEPEEIVNK